MLHVGFAMEVTMKHLSRLLLSVLLVSAVAAACGDTSDSSVRNGWPADAGSGDVSRPPDGAGGGLVIDVAGGGEAVSTDVVSTITIEPDSPTVNVETGQPIPTISFVAKVNGAATPAQWLIDRGELGSIGAKTGVFTPSGRIAGTTKVTATVGAASVSTNATVKVILKQNGASESDSGTGFGGWGGVGGEGPGVPVDPALLAVLQATPTADPALRWLYPYDKTLWPLGVLAPLLQWTPSAAPIDGVYIHLSSANFEYKGYFGRPAALPAGSPLVHHPIPQDVWTAATKSSAGGPLTVSLVVAAAGSARGPITQNWDVARGPLKGTVYYQSYGTALAKNYSGGIGGDGMFGGATLAIRGGSSDPTLVAGATGGLAECRVCHSVSLNGTRMIVQHGEQYASSSWYALTTGYPETSYSSADIGKFGWFGFYPDGSIGLSNAAPLYAGQLSSSQLYDVASGAPLPSVGLSEFVTRAGFPAFSPDGKHVAFNFYEGVGDANTGAGDGSQLVAMDFDKASRTFSNPKLLYKGPSDKCPGWPSFLPTNDAVVFSVQSRTNPSGEWMMTRYGARGELWWSDLATGTAHALDRANGLEAGSMYLPVGANGHDNDTTVQYEPTVNPVVSGGYAWVVFMSRRMYGNIATVAPDWSDPRDHDLTVTPTPKKLWVAAIDLNQPAGSDRSHPAFYLPAQELMAGNSRGFWVVDPCKPDGSPCESGDECCGGYCQMDAEAGGLICSQHPNQCAQEYDKCTTAADCCDVLQGMQCINGRCAMPSGPR
jgi:hypothetical protein